MQTIGNLTTSDQERISLYFHIPFCTKKCDYCHFYVIPDNEQAKDDLLEGFLLEWQSYLPLLKNKKIFTVYFGGGTPALFGPQRIAYLIKKISSSAHDFSPSEITLEANPENVTLDLFKAYAKSEINRVSIGIQTLDTTLLNLLGRMHQSEVAIQSVHQAHEAGIQNISIDLMYDLPQQTLADWEATLNQVKQLPITHLSLYNLTIEPHTIFFKKQNQLKPMLPNEETSLQMYEMAISKLESMGLQQYEISAFAKPGFESKHNSGYWTGRPFLGFGPSAFSYWKGKRFRNVANLKKYCAALKNNESPIDFSEELDPEAHRRELLVIQLRLKTGVLIDDFMRRHGPLDKETHLVIKKLLAEDFLLNDHEYIKLTKKGILFYDTVASELI